MPRTPSLTASSHSYLRPLRRTKCADSAIFQKLIREANDYLSGKQRMRLVFDENARTTHELNVKARSLQKKGHDQDALNLIWCVLKDHRGDVDALTTKMKILYRLAEDEKALEVAKRVLLRDRDSLAAHYIKARILLRMGKREEALKTAKSILRLSPRHYGASYIKAVIEEKHKASEAALNKFEELDQ